jgi:hypothetical protein
LFDGNEASGYSGNGLPDHPMSGSSGFNHSKSNNRANRIFLQHVIVIIAYQKSMVGVKKNSSKKVYQK